MKNVTERKRFVTDNALRAQATLDLRNSLYGKAVDSEAGSVVSPAARAGFEIMNKSGQYQGGKSNEPAKRADSISLVSGASKNESDVRRRML